MQKQSSSCLCQLFSAVTIGNMLEEQLKCKGSSG